MLSPKIFSAQGIVSLADTPAWILESTASCGEPCGGDVGPKRRMHEREWRGIHWLRASCEEAPNFDPPFLITSKACRADRRSNPTPNNIRLERLNHQIDFRRFEAGPKAL